LIRGTFRPQIRATTRSRRSAAPKVGAAGSRGGGVWRSGIGCPPPPVSARRGRGVKAGRAPPGDRSIPARQGDGGRSPRLPPDPLAVTAGPGQRDRPPEARAGLGG